MIKVSYLLHVLQLATYEFFLNLVMLESQLKCLSSMYLFHSIFIYLCS